MKRILKINMTTFGLVLMCIYILASFNALDIIIPSKWTTYALYSFLGWGGLTTILTIKREIISQSPYTLWYVTFMMISYFIMLYSPEISILSGEYYLMIVTFFLVYCIQLFIKDEKGFSMLCWFYGIASLALIVTLQLTGNLTASASNRLGLDIMGNANTFATMIMVAVLYELWIVVYGKIKISQKITLTLMILLNLYALILSAGKKFFIIPILFLYILLLFRTDKKNRKHIIKYTIFILLLVWILYYLIINYPIFYENIGYRIESYINGVFGVSEFGVSDALRQIMRDLALKEWFNSPIWGYGFDSFKYFAKDTIGEFVYSHCNYTELLYNGGIIYFVVYYWIYYKIFTEAYLKKVGQPKYQAFALAILVSFVAFDYGAVTYSIAIMQVMIAMALKVLTFKEDNKGELSIE